MVKQKVITHNDTKIEVSAESFIEKALCNNEKSFYIVVKVSNKEYSLVHLGTREYMSKNSIEKACEIAIAQTEFHLKTNRNKEYYSA